LEYCLPIEARAKQSITYRENNWNDQTSCQRQPGLKDRKNTFKCSTKKIINHAPAKIFKKKAWHSGTCRESQEAGGFQVEAHARPCLKKKKKKSLLVVIPAIWETEIGRIVV
jgi:hypothetical protein